MARLSVTLSAAVVLLIASACSPADPVSTSSTAVSASSTSAAVTESTSTTTSSPDAPATTQIPTTTAAPAPPFALFQAGESHNYVTDVTTVIVFLVDDVAITSLEFVASGKASDVYMETEDDGFVELSQGFQATALEFNSDTGPPVVVEGFEAAASVREARGLFMANGWIVVDSLGNPTSEVVGPSPGYLPTVMPVLEYLGHYGPVLSGAHVTVGDEWDADLTDPQLGPIRLAAEATGSVPGFDDRIAISFDARAIDPPPVFDLALILNALDLESAALDPSLFAGSTAEIRDASVTGSSTIDLSAGLVRTHKATTSYELEFPPVAGLAERLQVLVTTEVDRRLDSEAPSEFDRLLPTTQYTAVSGIGRALDQLAGPGRPVVWSFDAALRSRVAAYGPDLRTWDAATISIADDEGNVEDVGVVALRMAHDLAGDPGYSSTLLDRWSETPSRVVSIGGQPVDVGAVDGDRWLAYADAAYVYVVFGPDDAADRVMELVIEDVEPYGWTVGDCLSFTIDRALPTAPFGIESVTHCIGNTGYRVIHAETFDLGPAAPRPRDADEVAAQTCGAAFFEASGALPHASNFDLVVYAPDDLQWERGDRFLTCVRNFPLGVFFGSQELADSKEVGDIGVDACLLGSLRVECDQRHDAEVVSIGEIEGFGAYPELDDLFATLGDICDVAFAGEVVASPERDVRSSFRTDAHLGWDLGERTYYCVAEHRDTDGRLAPTEAQLIVRG